MTSHLEKSAFPVSQVRRVRQVQASLIRECHTSLECRLHDDALVDKCSFFISK